MPKAYFNPFYLLSVVVGVAFLITAFLYGVMAFRGASPHLLDGAQDQSALMDYMAKNGAMLLLGELGVLMLTTIAAIASDGFWEKFAKPVEEGSPETGHTENNEAAAGEIDSGEEAENGRTGGGDGA